MAPFLNLWQTLAAEIRIEIMKEILDLPTLMNLLIANPADNALFNRYHREILESVLGNMPADIGRVICATYNGRYNAAVTLDVMWDYMVVGKDYVRARTALKDQYGCADHLQILSSMAETTGNIYSFADRFAKQRILSPSGHPHGQLSPTERHRVLRAFWRFQHLYESNYCDGNDDRQGRRKGSKRYLSGRTWPNFGPESGEHWLRRSVPSSPQSWLNCGRIHGWEVTEIEAIREHLRAEVNSVQIDRHHTLNETDLLRRQPKMIQELINNVESWGSNSEVPSMDHALVAELGTRSFRGQYERSPGLNTPAGARFASIRYQDYLFMEERQGSMGIYEQWGWCMFDRERLIRCGLLPKDIPSLQRNREARIRRYELMTRFKRSHQECHMRLKDSLDPRIQVQFDADVVLSKQLVMRSKELEGMEQLMKWVKLRDAALFELWTTLLQSESFDRVEQMQAELYRSRVLLMQNFEDGGYKPAVRTSEEADLELLVLMRKHDNARKALNEVTIAFSEAGLD